MYASVDPTSELQQSKCPVCGGEEFEWGRLQVYYTPGTNLWSSRGRQLVKARRCLRCNNLMQFTDATMTGQQMRLVVVIAVAAVLISVGVMLFSTLMINTGPR